MSSCWSHAVRGRNFPFRERLCNVWHSDGRSSLQETLTELHGGLEIRCQVRLPIGSGLGTSSILAATVIRALAVMSGRTMDDQALSEAVMQLEQRMTTGGGWQDQAGGIFPGAKLLITVLACGSASGCSRWFGARAGKRSSVSILCFTIPAFRGWPKIFCAR